MRKIKEKKCKHCGTIDNLRTNKNGGTYNCCVICYKTIEIPDQIKKTKDALLEKYGVNDLGQLRQKRLLENPPIIKQKEIVPCKYCGTLENLVKSKSGEKRLITYPTCETHWEQYQREKHEQRKKSNLKRYGNENHMKIPEIQEKFFSAMKLNYGVKYPMQNKASLEKRNEANILKYGGKSPLNDPLIKEKSKKTLFKNYGVENPAQSKEIMKRVIATNKSRYWDTLIELLKERKIKPTFSKEDYINKDENFLYHCDRCNKDFISDGTEPQHIWCGCNQHRSKYEDEIIDWFKSIGISNIEPNKKFRENGKIIFEIDIYFTDFNFGIDFHGLYWHSDFVVSHLYHQNKYNYFKDKGIKLIQIFQNEWVATPNKVKSLLKNKIGKSESIYARKCEIKEISQIEYKTFTEINHLQGYATAAIKLGLFYNNELVCIASFGQNRFNRSDKAIEIIRFANKLDMIVVGGFQKILKYFETHYKFSRLVSFVDVRYFSGDSLLSNGFVLKELTYPNHFYFEPKNILALYSRFEFQKHKLKDKLKNFDPLLSEYDNMINNGYLRIFDAGNLKMVKNY